MGRQRSVGTLGGASFGAAIGVLSILAAPTQATAQAFSSNNAAGAANATATGANSTAGGYGSSATGADSTVLGNSSTDHGFGGAVALGFQAAVSANSAVAVGNGSQATGTGGIALGLDSTAKGNAAIAIGSLATTGTGSQSIAIGAQTSALGDQSTALGNNVAASGNSAVAIGGDDLDKVTVSHGALYTTLTGGTLAVGTYISTQATDGSTAIGVQSTASGFFATSIGLKASASGAGSFAIGAATVASGQGSGAFGLAASSTGQNSLSAGTDTSATAAYATAFGSGGTSATTATQATAIGALALGGNATAGAKATGANSIAIGGQSVANQSGDVAVGLNTVAGLTTPGLTNDTAVGTGARASGGNALAVGAGATATGNANSTAIGAGANAGGNLSIALGTGANTGTFTSGIAFGSNAVVTGNGSTAIGGNTTAAGIKSIALGDTAQALASGSIVVGRNTVANAAGDIAIGQFATSTGVPGVGSAVSIGPSNSATGAGAVAIGDPSVANGTGAFAGGFNSIATADGTPTGGPANGAVAIGNASVAYGQGSVALGNTSTTGGAGAIAVGDTANAAAARGIALGSGSVATNANDVALGATSTTGTAVATTGATIGGTAYTFAGTTPTSTVSVGAPGLERTITNVAAGRLSATSTDAINGSQLYATNTAVNTNAASITALGTTTASTLGNGATYNPTTGITGFSSNVAGGAQTTVGGALSALDTAAQTQGTGLAAALGGGTAVAPNGTVTAPVFTVGAGNYGTVAGALNALQTGAPVQYSTAAAPTTPNGYNASQNVTLVGAAAGPVTLSNVAPGTLSPTSTQAVDGSQLFATNTQVTNNTNAIANVNNGVTGPIQRGPAANVLTATAPGGTAAAPGAAQTLTNIAAGGLTATSTDAVNGSQLYGTNQNVAALTNGTVGLVQQNPTTRAITVGAGTDGTTVGFANNAGAARTLTGVAPGQVAAGSTQAVNGGQLFGTAGSVATALGGGSTVNPDGTVSTPAYTVGGQTYNNVGSALTASTGLAVQYTPSATGAATNAVDLTKGGTLAPVALTGLAPGALTGSSTAAVNGSQLFATNQTVAANTANASTLGTTTAGTLGNGATYNPATGITGFGSNVAGGAQTTVGGALSALDTAAQTQGTGLAATLGGGAAVSPNGTVTAPVFTVGAGNYGTVAGALNALQTGAPVQYSTAAAPTTPNGYIASQNLTLVGAAAGPVTLSNIAPGGLTGTSTDAVNGSQLFATNAQVTNNTNAITNASNGLTGPIQRGAAVNVLTATAPGGTAATPGAAQTLTNIAAGGVTATSTDAVNGSQLYGTNQNVAALTNGTAGLVQQDPTTRAITVGAGTDGTSVGFANNAGAARTLTGVAPGQVAAGSTQAVNGGQLFGTAGSVATALGGGSTVNPDGTVSTPAYTVGGQTYNNVGSALTASTGLAVQYTPSATGAATNAVDLTKGGTLAPVALTGLAAGALTATSADAVNGSQLYATNTQVANDTNAIANASNGLTGPIQRGAAANVLTATAPGGTAATPGAAQTLTNIAAGGLTATSTDAVNGSQLYGTNQNVAALTNGTAGLVQQDPTTRAITVGAGTDGTTVGFANNTGAARTLTGVASGQVAAGSTQAVNGGQLFGTAGSVATALGGGSTVNPDGTVSTPAYTVGGQTYNNVGSALTASNGLAVQYTPSATGTATNAVDLTKGGTLAPVALTGLAAGALTATSADAVNGSQLFATNVQIATTNAGSAILGTTAANTLGGGATYNPATGITGFSPTVAGGTQTSVGGALSALDMAAQTQGSGLAAALGGGASVASNGTVTAPAFTVGTGSYGTVGGALGALQTAAPLQYATAAAPTTANGFNPSQNATLVGAAAGPVTLSNVASGALSGTSTQAVNGSQLYATNQSVAALTSGTAGLVQQATPTSPITIGAGSGGTLVNVAGTAGPRVVTGLANGAVGATSTDAVNGQQLYGSIQSVAAALGGGSTVGANGALTAPTFSVQGASYNSVGGAVGAIDGSLTSLNAAVSGGGGIKYFHGNSTLADSQALGANSVAIGPQAVATNAGDVALGFGSTTGTTVATSSATIAGTTYGFAGAAPTSTLSLGSANMQRTITNVAAGRLTGTSTDAVNGSQLYATNQAVNGLGAASAQLGASTAASLGGGASYDPTSGKLAAPTYTVGQMAYNDVGSAVGALQSGAGLQYSTSTAPTTANGYVPSQDVTLVGASAGPVILHNVGAGVASTDAANVGQLPGAFTSPTSNTFAFAQAGGTGAPVTLSNVAAGVVSATSTQAVNGSQLYGLASSTSTALNNLAQGFGQLQQEVASNDRRASAGTAIALAATGLHYDDRPGKFSVGAATAVYRRQVGVSAGLAHTSEDGRWRVNAAASFAPTDNKADVGAVVGASYSFN